MATIVKGIESLSPAVHTSIPALSSLSTLLMRCSTQSTRSRVLISASTSAREVLVRFLSSAEDTKSTSVAARALPIIVDPTTSAPCSMPENRVAARATLRKRARNRALPRARRLRAYPNISRS